MWSCVTCQKQTTQLTDLMFTVCVCLDFEPLTWIKKNSGKGRGSASGAAAMTSRMDIKVIVEIVTPRISRSCWQIEWFAHSQDFQSQVLMKTLSHCEFELDKCTKILYSWESRFDVDGEGKHGLDEREGGERRGRRNEGEETEKKGKWDRQRQGLSFGPETTILFHRWSCVHRSMKVFLIGASGQGHQFIP